MRMCREVAVRYQTFLTSESVEVTGEIMVHVRLFPTPT